MKAKDVADTLNPGLNASGCNYSTDRPHLLSYNGSSYVTEDLAEFFKDKRMEHVHGRPSANLRFDRTLAPNTEEPHLS